MSCTSKIRMAIRFEGFARMAILFEGFALYKLHFSTRLQIASFSSFRIFLLFPPLLVTLLSSFVKSTYNGPQDSWFQMRHHHWWSWWLRWVQHLLEAERRERRRTGRIHSFSMALHPRWHLATLTYLVLNLIRLCNGRALHLSSEESDFGGKNRVEAERSLLQALWKPSLLCSRHWWGRKI